MRRLPLSIYALIICLLAGIGCKASADNRMIMTGDDPYNLRVLAFQCYIEGQTESALETYQRAVKRAIEEYGDDSTIVADIYYEMGSLAFDAGKENTAESWLNESLKRNPNSEMARIKLAEIYRVRSKHDQALAQIQTCLKRNRNSITARRALVVWLQEKGFVALATQESYVLNQISAGNKDHRIAPSASTQVATAIKNPPEASIKKEEVAPTKAAEPKPEAKPAQKVKAPPSIVAALMKRVETAAKKKEQPAVKPVAKQPVVKQPVVVKQPKKLVKPESKKEENKKEAPKKEEPKQEVAKTPPAKKIEKPPAPRMEPPVVATTQPKRSKNGLVPPPPPIMPPFGMFPPPPPMGFNNGPLLQTHAALKKEKPKAEPKESPKEAKETAKDTKDTASVDEEGEGDFLIDWAATKKKKKAP